MLTVTKDKLVRPRSEVPSIFSKNRKKKKKFNLSKTKTTKLSSITPSQPTLQNEWWEHPKMAFSNLNTNIQDFKDYLKHSLNDSDALNLLQSLYKSSNSIKNCVCSLFIYYLFDLYTLRVIHPWLFIILLIRTLQRQVS
jgi:hypothetical protein